MPQSLPPRWTQAEFERNSTTAMSLFRDERMKEPLEAYLRVFAEYRKQVEELIDATSQLRHLSEMAPKVLSNGEHLTAARYLASPAISVDDLKVLANTSLSTSSLTADPAVARRVIDTILLGLDRERFPWVAAGRPPSSSERVTAIVSTAALIATQRVQTLRRNAAKRAQEASVADTLLAHGFTRVPARTIENVGALPEAGEFCGESTFGSRKADLVIRLYDGRAMPTECKVSNSSANSVKRLNNDAAVKADTWLKEFGTQTCVPAAVLSGVFKVHNLLAAQNDKGLTVFWAHDLGAMLRFIDSTRT